MPIRLPEPEELLRAVVDDAPDYAFVMLDPTGRIERWNRGATVLFGHPADEIRGRHFSTLFTVDDVNAGVPEAELQKAAEEGKALDRRWHPRRDGTRFFADGVTTALWAAGDLVGFVKLARDVTVLKAADEDRQRLLAREQQLHREKDDFLAAVSHELRTPLTAINGWLSLLRRDPIDRQTFEEGMTAIEQASATLGKLVDDLLDAVRSRSGKMRITAQPLDLAPVVVEALQAFRLPLEAKRIAVHQDVAAGVMILGDATRLHQIMWNLISNAIRHNPPGGTIDVALRREGSEAVVEVRDTGDGIEPALLPYIFEPFRQNPTASGGGLGLGLAIARSLVELHGGTISAESAGPGLGATFRIRLPLL
jgi:two-component system CheB/CheR fusion protein